MVKMANFIYFFNHNKKLSIRKKQNLKIILSFAQILKL